MRYWYSYDFASANITSTPQMVTGWCFGDSESEAESKARQEAVKRYPQRGILKTAKINLQLDRD